MVKEDILYKRISEYGLVSPVRVVTRMRTRREYRMSQLNWIKKIHHPRWWITSAYIICRSTIQWWLSPDRVNLIGWKKTPKMVSAPVTVSSQDAVDVNILDKEVSPRNTYFLRPLEYAYYWHIPLFLLGDPWVPNTWQPPVRPVLLNVCSQSQDKWTLFAWHPCRLTTWLL